MIPPFERRAGTFVISTDPAKLDRDAIHDGWYVNDAKQGLSAADPNDVTS